MNIYEKMNEAKIHILKAKLKKSGENKFAGFKYFELADILPEIVYICQQLKLHTKVTFTESEAVLTITNAEDPKEILHVTSPMKETELKGCNAIQALGGVETYQRRYLYMAAFDIIENDLFDAKTGQGETISKNVYEALVSAIGNKNIPSRIITDELAKRGYTKLIELQNEELASFKKAIGVD